MVCRHRENTWYLGLSWYLMIVAPRVRIYIFGHYYTFAYLLFSVTGFGFALTAFEVSGKLHTRPYSGIFYSLRT